MGSSASKQRRQRQQKNRQEASSSSSSSASAAEKKQPSSTSSSPTASQAKPSTETGAVSFLCSSAYEQARRTSAREGKPIFLLFDEIPGCSTCTRFGRDVLGDAVIVAAIEDLFVPVVVNNRGKSGADRKLLEAFGEPMLNNPVVRFILPDGKESQRQSGVYDAAGTIRHMLRALDCSKKHGAPSGAKSKAAFLSAHARWLDRERVYERATVSQACFWVGEARIGAIPGVVTTTAGWLGGSEVTEAWFDPSKTSYKEVVAQAARLGVASEAFAHNEQQVKAAAAAGLPVRKSFGKFARAAKQSDQKRQLCQANVRFVPLTPPQQTWLNSRSGSVKTASHDLFAPSQLHLLQRVVGFGGRLRGVSSCLSGAAGVHKDVRSKIRKLEKAMAS